MDMPQTPIQVQKFLEGVDYPATKDAIMDAAKKNKAPENIMKILQKLKDNIKFNKPTDISKELGNFM